MLKLLINLAVLLFSVLIFGQKIKEYNPVEIREIKTEFTDDFIERYNSAESLKRCNEIWSKQFEKGSSYVLTNQEMESLALCDEFDGNPWSRLPSGCSWYCGGIIDSIYSSSGNAKFIHDFDYGKCWISDNDFKSIPNFIEYVFKPESSRVTDIVIVNGNAKSEILFKEFSRAKKIKMYVNNNEFAILNLKDTKNEQVFRFNPIGTKNRKDYERMKLLPKWTIKFEIVDVYQGSNQLVSISEIYFDGELVEHEDN